MANIIEVKDCRGYRVYCTEEIWYDKILISRPWMEGWEDLIIEVLQTPSYICQDPKRTNRNIYYLIHRTKKDRYIRVVARFSNEKVGFLISAYPADSGKEGEKVIWMASKG